MDLQSISSLEDCITLITLKSILLIGFQISLILHGRHWCVFLGKKLLFTFGIPLDSGGACPLLPAFRSRYFSSSGIQRKGEAGANGEGKLEVLALSVQCLAEVHALVDQGGAVCTNDWMLVHLFTR